MSAEVSCRLALTAMQRAIGAHFNLVSVRFITIFWQHGSQRGTGHREGAAAAAATLHMAREAVGLILIIRRPRQTRNMVYVNKQSRPSGQVAKWLSRFGPLIKRALSID